MFCKKYKMKFIVNENEYEIETIIYHKQCKEYNQAIKEGDYIKANLLYIPPTHISEHIIDAKIKAIELQEMFKEEMKRIDEMDPNVLKMELKIKYK